MTTKALYKALAAFQQEVPVIHKGTTGFGYSYADLPAIFEVINPLMAKHGLGFYQAVNDNCIRTEVFHIESGEFIWSNTTIPQGVSIAKMNDFQVLGSAITYIRRYALSAMLGLVTDKDTDAGGEQAKATRPKLRAVGEPLNKTCPNCGKEHTGSYAKCLECYKAGLANAPSPQQVARHQAKLNTEEIDITEIPY